MIVILKNQTAIAKSYVAGNVILAGSIGASTTVPITYQIQIATDGVLHSDIVSGNVFLNDGTNDYSVNDAVYYLSLIHSNGVNFGQQTSANSMPVVISSDQNSLTIQGGSGTPGTPSGGILTIQGVSGGQMLPVSQATASNLNAKAQLQDNSGNGITSTSINSLQRLNVTLASEAQDGAAAPFYTIQVGGMDPTGKAQSFITDSTGVLFNKDVINVSSQFRAQSVTTSAAEALGAATILVNRKFISITPTNGTVYWGTANTVTTANGSPLFANNTLFLSFTDNVHVYLISAGTVDVRILEGS